jgi:hypothetical protein
MKKETEEAIVGWFNAMSDFLPENTIIQLKKNFADNLGIDLNEIDGDGAFLFAALAVYFMEKEGVIRGNNNKCR